MGYELRRVTTEAERAAMHAIRRATLFTEERHPGVVYDENHPHDLAPTHEPHLLPLDGQPVGVVRLDFRGREAVVRLVAIAAERQGQGHGRAMSDLVDVKARSRGVRRLMVNAWHEAVGFYERTGWQREVWDAAELANFGVNCVQMTKEI